MKSFNRQQVEATIQAFDAGDVRDLSASEQAKLTEQTYKHWLRDNNFRDTIELRQAFDAGWVAGCLAGIEKFTATIMKEMLK